MYESVIPDAVILMLATLSPLKLVILGELSNGSRTLPVSQPLLDRLGIVPLPATASEPAPCLSWVTVTIEGFVLSSTKASTRFDPPWRKWRSAALKWLEDNLQASSLDFCFSRRGDTPDLEAPGTEGRKSAVKHTTAPWVGDAHYPDLVLLHWNWMKGTIRIPSTTC